MIMSLFQLPRQKLSLKFIPFGKNYEQCCNHFCNFQDQNIFQPSELAVKNKKCLKIDCSGKKIPRSAFLFKKDITIS